MTAAAKAVATADVTMGSKCGVVEQRKDADTWTPTRRRVVVWRNKQHCEDLLFFLLWKSGGEIAIGRFETCERTVVGCH